MIGIENRQVELEKHPIEVELDLDVESSIAILIVSCSLHSDSAMNTEEVVMLGWPMSSHLVSSGSHPSFLHGLNYTTVHLINKHTKPSLTDPIESSQFFCR